MTYDPAHGTALRAVAASWTSFSLTQVPPPEVDTFAESGTLSF
jgi:hypothetical protein